MKIFKNVKICEYNVPNKNGRIYTADCFNLDKNPVLKEKLDNNCLFGELGFPDDYRAEVDMTKVSHRILKLENKLDGLYADIEILDTPCGRVLEKIATKDNFRTIGDGWLTEDKDGNNIVEDYTLLTIDYTSDPA